jgi:hypothetical protein
MKTYVGVAVYIHVEELFLFAGLSADGSISSRSCFVFLSEVLVYWRGPNRVAAQCDVTPQRSHKNWLVAHVTRAHVDTARKSVFPDTDFRPLTQENSMDESPSCESAS